MAEFPSPGADKDTWGDKLIEVLRIEHNNDGTQKHAYAMMNNSIAQSIPTGNWTKLEYNTSGYDSSGNIVDLANNRLIPDTSGHYVVTLVAGIVNITDGKEIGIRIQKNVATLLAHSQSWMPLVGGDADPILCTSCLVYLNGSTDYVEAYVYQDTGVNRDIHLPGVPSPFFLHRIDP